MDRIGFVGLGTMGAAMAANLRRAGFPLTVWNRTPGRAGDLIAQGATEAKTTRELAGQVDIVVTCVSDTSDVEAVLFGEDGIAADKDGAFHARLCDKQTVEGIFMHRGQRLYGENVIERDRQNPEAVGLLLGENSCQRGAYR